MHTLALGWVGGISLKNVTLTANFYFMRGNFRLSEAVFPRDGAPLTTSQRMRLEPPQLDALTARMRSETEFALLFVTPSPESPDPVSLADSFNKNFVRYLIEKQAAGIVRLTTGIIYLFPPCPFAFTHISSQFPDVVRSESDLKDYLLAVVFRSV